MENERVQQSGCGEGVSGVEWMWGMSKRSVYGHI